MHRLLLTLTVCLPFSLAFSQSSADLVEQLRQGSEDGRREVITESMALSTEESEVFWPVYDDYRNEMADVQKRLFGLVAEYADAYPDITDTMANHFMDEFISMRHDEVVVKVKHFKEFRSVLAPRRAARFIQLDTKLDALVNIDAAQNIPLVE